VILAGLRVATVLIVGIAAIAAAVNGPGLGEDIFVGLARIGSASALNYVLGGMLGVVVLAILFDAAYAGLARITTSRGIRG
jgi:osmoprotectant transport system permease protein